MPSRALPTRRLIVPAPGRKPVSVFLKSLTLRGFKSFADKTELELEPGITVVVGPNGSGKSNVVDALTWVLGSHSAKSLRGGSMADVIFAGSPDKPGLGRAAVEITIDNADGTLPIEFSEVTISRSMFASGENTYAINGVDCRLLDVAELLSDTGLGRENHTIVGQGQLDSVLNARPEDRRAFIEEAAGILKHRKRKERALRKIAQMEQHVERLTDLVSELKRNLRPLERQAEAAAKHAALQAELQRVRAVRAVRELDGLDRRLSDEAEAKRASDERVAGLEGELIEARESEAAIESRLAALTPQVRAAGQTHFALANLVERYRGLVDRISERRRGLATAVDEPVAGRDPGELRASAARERTSATELARERSAAAEAFAAAQQATRAAEQARRAHEQAAAAEARRRAQEREQRLRWEGEIAALRSSLAQAASEEGRMASQLQGLTDRRAELEHDATAVDLEIQRLDADQSALAERLRAAEQEASARQEEARLAAVHERDLERRRASLEARADALRTASEEAGGGAKALLEAAANGEAPQVIGPLADHVQVDESYARAIAAALGPLGDALVVASQDGARHALVHLAELEGGRVLLLPHADGADAADEDVARDRALVELGAARLVDRLTASDGLDAALRRAMAGTYLVDDLDAATACARRFPQCTFVTTDGQVAGPRGWAGGSSVASSAVLSRAAAEEAERELTEVERQSRTARRSLEVADDAAERARAAQDAAAAAMTESDGQLTSAAERLGRLRKQLAAADREQEALEAQRTDLDAEMRQQRERLRQLEERDSPGTQEGDEPVHGPDLEAERLDDELGDAREAEVQARLAVSAVEQREAELHRRITALETEADQVEQQLVERERRKAARQEAIAGCRELSTLAETALQRVEHSLAAAETERDRLEERRAAQQRDLGVVRARTRELDETLQKVRDARHAEELRRTELIHAADAVTARIRDEVRVDPVRLLAAARGELSSVPPAAAGDQDGRARPAADEPGTDPDGRTGDVDPRALVSSDGEPLWEADPLEGGSERDEELRESEERLVRKVGLLGTVNPLALKEYAALKERHAFMTEQLEDLHGSRADLLEVLKAVDARISEVFAAAFADVAAQFSQIFPRLFPGGDGRLVLTDPDDLLNSGVEVEARPPGKRVKRLSLLSGGERSLTALAVLFAIFAARPSPFYVLDEVEAALDDVNLQRFLDVVTDFRASSQLVIVTHQKRTMEVADTLYGVTMHGSGVSKVLSQRITMEPAAS